MEGLIVPISSMTDLTDVLSGCSKCALLASKETTPRTLLTRDSPLYGSFKASVMKGEDVPINTGTGLNQADDDVMMMFHSPAEDATGGTSLPRKQDLTIPSAWSKR
jgi:hypothetical protein